MITNLISQFTEKQLELFLNNLNADGRQFLKVLLADEDNHIKRLTLDPQSLEIRKLAMKPKRTEDENRLLESAPKAWMGKVDGKKVSVSEDTLAAVNSHLQYYERRKQFLSKTIDKIQERGEIFFGVPISRYIRDYKTFKKLLLKKTLEEPHAIRNYLVEFLDAYNSDKTPRPFAEGEKLRTFAVHLDEALFKKYSEELNNCIVSSLSLDIVTMLETLLMKASQADKKFNEAVWRETKDILPVFHNQHLRYTYHFLSLFLINTKASVLPRSMNEMAIIALIRKVEELC